MNSSLNSIKLTSKHQLTVPAAVVRQLKLQAGARLTYKVKDGAIILKPRPGLGKDLDKLWADSARLNKGVASDESIKESVREYYRSQKRP